MNTAGSVCEKALGPDVTTTILTFTESLFVADAFNAWSDEVAGNTGVQPHGYGYLLAGGVAQARKAYNTWYVTEFKEDKDEIAMREMLENARLSLFRARENNYHNLRALSQREINRLYSEASNSHDPTYQHLCHLKITSLMKENFAAHERMKREYQDFHRIAYHASDDAFFYRGTGGNQRSLAAVVNAQNQVIYLSSDDEEE